MLPQEAEFIFRRTFDPLSDQAVALPVLFALVVLLLLVAFRTGHRMRTLLVGLGAITAASIVYVPLALVFKPAWTWWVVLVPFLLIGLAYVALMYRKDARSIHRAVAVILGLMRCAVYAILAFVFLLPGLQNYETNESHAKVLFLFDVSGSMKTKDDLPQLGEDPAALPSRQDKVAAFMSEAKPKQPSFLGKILAKTPGSAYRFGTVADEINVLQWAKNQTPNDAEFKSWLNPDKQNIKVPAGLDEKGQAEYRSRAQDTIEALLGGTNVGGAALQVAKLEGANYLQAIVLVSDGQSNVGGDSPLKEFLARVNNSQRSLPVFTIGVGDYREPASIRIDDLQAPETARPDDKFPIRVPVVGVGLPDEEFTVMLDAQRVKDATGSNVTEEKFVLGPVKGKFQGGGDNPRDQVEFEIDLQDLKKVKAIDDKKGDLEGSWEFTARVPRHAREAFAKPEHVSDPPTPVLVQKKKLRVLLFAGGPGRDYQFVRTMLYREVIEKRMELSVYLQTGREDNVDQDVENDRLLAHFPDHLSGDDVHDKYYNLSEYDVVLAFDPDWTALETTQLNMLKDWVGTHAGGVVFVAGPVYSYHLARPAGLDISSLLTIFPVVLTDSRLQGLGIGHDSLKPYLLHFTPAARLFDFLKLDEKEDSPTAGWDAYFWGAKDKVPADPNARPLRGFHTYYPVERTKPDSTVIATFSGPESSRINDGKDEQPYIVTMRYGNGKTLYIGSAETWRLRTYKEAFHERFWIKLLRYVSAGTTAQKRYGRILLGRTTSTGNITFEAQVKGQDLLPLSRDLRPTVFVRKIAKRDEPSEGKPIAFDLKPKAGQGDWNGWFIGSLPIREPGEYEFKLPIPGTTESLTHTLLVKKPNVELDNVKNDFDQLYQIATEATPVLNRLSPDARREVEKSLLHPGSTETPRLFFPLSAADAITQCIADVPPRRESTKKTLEYIWDKGLKTGYEVSAFAIALAIPLAVGLLGFGILFFLKQRLGAALFLLGGALLAALMAGIYSVTGADWPMLDVDLSFVLVTVVTLLSIEWLTRKMLKLA